MGLTLKTTGVFLLLLLLLNGTAANEPPLPEDLPAQDNVLPEDGEPQAALTSALTEAEALLDSSIDQYRAAITEHEAQLGPFDAELGEMNYSLGKTLQLRYRFQEAIETYRHAMHLKRVNDGVFSLTQEPMLRGMIESQSALGQIDDAGEHYQQLLWLYRKSYGDDDPRLISIMEEISRWHMQVYNRRGTQDDIYHLLVSYGMYTYAISIATQQYGAYDLRLVSLLEHSALANYYLSTHNKTFPSSWENAVMASYDRVPRLPGMGEELSLNRNYYQNGRRDYKRMFDVLENNPAAKPEDIAKGYVSLGDWLLLFDKTTQGMHAYEKAVTILTRPEVDNGLTGELFGAPIMLPRPAETEYWTNRPTKQGANTDTPDNTDASTPANIAQSTQSPPPLPSSREYVMVAVDVSATGVPDKIDTVSFHPEKNESLEKRARKAITSSRFRPRFEKGSPVLTKALPVRVIMN
ncbi:energy transducer TonB [Porticoccus sp.]